MEKIEFVDLSCGHCGKDFEPDEREVFHVEKLGNGTLIFTSNDEPYYFTCPYCQHKSMMFKPGKKTNGNNVNVVIKGNISGSTNIIIGNGNIAK